MRLTIVVQNLAHGGLANSEGDPEDRWPALRERINAMRPDVLLLCEAVGWNRYGHRQLARAMEDLDMDAPPLAPSRSGYGTALLYRRETIGRWRRHNPDFGKEALHGLAVTSFEVGLPNPLSFVPIHFTPFSAEQAIIEADYAASRGYRYGPFAVLGGDVNFAPASDEHPEPDFSEMRPYNIGSRTLLPDGDHIPDRLTVDRRVTRKLVHNGLSDVAWRLYQQTGDAELLRPTGTDDRIDQIWVSGPLAEAVSDYQVLDSPAGASDHHGVAAVLDTDRIDTEHLWTYR